MVVEGKAPKMRQARKKPQICDVYVKTTGEISIYLEITENPYKVTTFL